MRALAGAKRVLIVEDHALFAESLELALGHEGYDVRRIEVGEARAVKLSALLAQIVRAKPWVVLLDLDLGEVGDSLGVIRPLAERGINVVVVTASTSEPRWGACIQHGARAVISKGCSLRSIISTVRTLAQGRALMSIEERERLIGAWRREYATTEPDRLRLQQLTTREREVLGELMTGRNVREISAGAYVSEATVRTQVKSILAKLGVSSQLAAVAMAHRLGWRPPPGVAATD